LAYSNQQKPKAIHPGPEDYPWYETCIIKNVPKGKTYGPEYAEKQNKQLKKTIQFFKESIKHGL